MGCRETSMRGQDHAHASTCDVYGLTRVSAMSSGLLGWLDMLRFTQPDGDARIESTTVILQVRGYVCMLCYAVLCMICYAMLARCIYALDATFACLHALCYAMYAMSALSGISVSIMSTPVACVSLLLCYQLLDRKQLQLMIKFREKRRKVNTLKAPEVQVRKDVPWRHAPCMLCSCT